MSRSRAEIEAETATSRLALEGSLADLRGRLAPRQLAQEVGGSLTDRLADASQRVSATAATPGGVVAMAGMAFASAFAASGGMSKPIPTATSSADASGRAVTVHTDPPLSRDTLLMLAQLSAAVAAGAVASRFIPITPTERNLMDGVGPELRRFAQTRIAEGARKFAAPDTTKLGPLNLAAMFAAALLTRRA